METALHQDLIAAEIDRFLNLLVQHLFGKHIGFRVPLGSVERAEIAHRRTGVAVIDVAIDVVRADSLRMHSLGDGMGRFADADQVVRMQQRKGIVRRETFTRDRLSEQRFQVAGGECRRGSGRCESGHVRFEGWKIERQVQFERSKIDSERRVVGTIAAH